MHELSLIHSLLEIAAEHARRAGATAIRSLTVEVGEHAGVCAEALEFAFTACRAGTPAAAATLVVRRIAGQGWCAGCRRTVPAPALTARCPVCGEPALTIEQGNELRLIEMEVD